METIQQQADTLFNRINALPIEKMALMLSSVYGRMQDEMNADDLKCFKESLRIYEGKGRK